LGDENEEIGEEDLGLGEGGEGGDEEDMDEILGGL
jgi:hypothetical protein